MGKIDVRSIDFEDEYYETYEKFTKRNRKQNIDEGDLQQSQGKSGRGRKVTLISLNEQKEEVVVSDPFDIEWKIPIKFLLDTY